MKNFFKKLMYSIIPPNDIMMFEALGETSFIRNGVGYGFISDEYLYNNGFLEIGIGRIRSGYGDWGGGFDHATDSPLKITINRNYIIQKIETCSFYNSSKSEMVEELAKKISKKLKIGNKFVVKNEMFKNSIDEVFKVIPCKSHIGHDVFESPHMLKHFTDPKEMSNYSFEDAECLKNETK